MGNLSRVILALSFLVDGVSSLGASPANIGLALARLVALNFLALLATRLGLGSWPCRRPSSSADGEPSSDGTEQPSVRELSALPASGAAMNRALLLEEGIASTPANGSVVSSPSEGDARASKIDATIAEQQNAVAKQQARYMFRNAALVVAYLFVAVSSVWMAIRIVNINVNTSSGQWQAFAEAVCLLMANFEFYLLKGLVIDATSDEPVHLVGMHNHPLYWTNSEGKGFCRCRVCNEKIGEKTGGYLNLQCRNCVPNNWGYGGFNVCVNCYRKRASKLADGQAKDAMSILRGDKGPKPEYKLTPWQYCCRVLVLLRPLAGISAVAMTSVCISQGLSAYLPKCQGDIMNALVSGDRDKFHLNITRFVIIVAVISVVSFAKSVAVNTMYTRLYNNMAVGLFKALLRQDVAFYDHTMTGQLTARLTNDLSQATYPIPSIMNSLIANVVMLVVGFSVCLSDSWRLTILAFTFLSPVAYVNGLYARWASSIQASQWTYISDAQGGASQALTNIRTVRSFCAGDAELAKYEGHMRKSMDVGLKNAWGQGGATLLSGFLEQGASFIILYYGGLLVLDHDGFEVGSIITFSYLWNRLSSAFQGLNDNMNAPIKAMSAGQRVFEIMDLQPDISEETGAGPSGSRGMQVDFRDIEFTYQSRPDKVVLKKVNLTLEAGKTLALCGKSGCGKSTISKLLLRMYDPQKGSVLVNNVSLEDLHLPTYRKCIGVVSQETQLFRATIAENITYGMTDSEFTFADVEHAARLANADEFIRTLPEGYKTVIGEGGHDLSGGQKQRLSIARALVRRPQILLLDEATSALDAENEALVQEAIEAMMVEVRGQCTILIIAHRLSTIKDANRIMVLHEGEVVEDGTHEDLLSKDGRYAAMISRQLQGGKDTADDSPAAASREASSKISELFETLPDEERQALLKSLCKDTNRGRARLLRMRS
mmetsp:Transcript_57053/g.92415  ORF Transcript_57053/g.92415 Transcript_57053/m.92415 type:complete len:941 (-) Transcript_57053:15-2837(-)